MPSTTPNADTERLSALQEQLQEQLKALEGQFTRAQQRQHDQFEGEIHGLRQQLATLAHEQQSQQKTALTASHEAVEALRKDVIEALHRLTGDLDRVAQHTETQVERALQRLRHEVQDLLQEREQAFVSVEKLGDLLIALGKQLHNTARGKDA